MFHSHNLEKISSLNGETIYYCGPALKKEALPTVFYFALSGEDSLTLDPFNQPVQFLHDANVRVFSLSIPGHGAGLENTRAMGFWSEQIHSGHDIVSTFIAKCVDALTFLIDQGYVDPDNIAVAGLSRGGFIATHFAAKDPRVKTLLGYAPLISLADLKEFEGLRENSLVQSLNLENLTSHLTDKNVHFFIGNRDTRVNTDHCYQFIRTLTEEAYQQGIRSPTVELSIAPSIGHGGHGTAPHTFNEGVDWLKSCLLNT